MIENYLKIYKLQKWREQDINFTVYDLNKAFFRDLQKKLEIYNHNACVGQIFLKYIPFFKMYFQYLQEFKIDQISILRNQYQDFNNFLNNLEEACVFKGGDLNSFLIKPVQRLPRYTLLLTSIVKCTWKDHPDYQVLQKTLNQFASVTQQIDLLIGNILKNQALFELQSKFFNLINVQIVESTRQFILTESLCMINQGKEDPINLYLCTDLIVLTKMNEQNQKYIKEGLITYQFLDLQSYYKSEQLPSLNFTLIAGEQQMVFTCQDQEQKQKLQLEFDAIFTNLKNVASLKSSKQKKKTQIYSPITVQIVSITRGKELLKSYAQYNIIVIKQLQNYATQTRHKVLLKLQKKLKTEFQEESNSEIGSSILFYRQILYIFNYKIGQKIDQIKNQMMEEKLLFKSSQKHCQTLTQQKPGLNTFFVNLNYQLISMIRMICLRVILILYGWLKIKLNQKIIIINNQIKKQNSSITNLNRMK